MFYECPLKYFRHNDVQHLAYLMELHAKEELKNPKLAKMTRKFLVVEGIYQNTGEICNLKEMVELKNKHKVRLFVDESLSFGVLGYHGRGITEHLDIPVILSIFTPYND